MLLLFFAIPLATIILSVILETLIHSPSKIAGIAFAIFLIVAFALGGTTELLIAAIIYTIIAFVTAAIVKIIHNTLRFDHHGRRGETRDRSEARDRIEAMDRTETRDRTENRDRDGTRDRPRRRVGSIELIDDLDLDSDSGEDDSGRRKRRYR